PAATATGQGSAGCDRQRSVRPIHHEPRFPRRAQVLIIARTRLTTNRCAKLSQKPAAMAAAFALSHSAHAALDVFACEPEWAALSKEVGGEKVSVYQATTAMQDPHRIEARPSLIAHTRAADLLVCTGADLEVGWLPVLLQTSGNSKVQANQPGYFMASDFVTKLEVPKVLDRSQGDVH